MQTKVLGVLELAHKYEIHSIEKRCVHILQDVLGAPVDRAPSSDQAPSVVILQAAEKLGLPCFAYACKRTITSELHVSGHLLR